VGGALSAAVGADSTSFLALMVLRSEDAKLFMGSCCRASTLKVNEVKESSVFRHLEWISSLLLLMYAIDVAGVRGGGSIPTAADILCRYENQD
jgi:hypothetical protein